MSGISQRRLPAASWMDERGWRPPGAGPIAPEDGLLRRDEAFAARRAPRDRGAPGLSGGPENAA
ncbi:hypothetical protein [Amaricoccus solimangrovi]|nr:hypothetical protein [Amaricoccus solimangrovi]